MKMLKAIRDADALRPNKLSTPRKAEILMVLEHRIAEMMGAEAPAIKVSVEDDTASVEDMELLRILSKEDKLTIQIAFLKMSGYNGYEIAEKTGLTQKAVNLRMVRLRKKLKNFFET